MREQTLYAPTHHYSHILTISDGMDSGRTVKISGRQSAVSSFFARGRERLRRRFSLQPPFRKDESDGEKSPKPPRRPDRSADRTKSQPTHIKHRVVVMGASRTGKTAIINQFLYNTFTPRYKRTIEEMHHGEFEAGGVHLSLQILDTCGENEFPAMRNLSITNADAFILVYDVSEPSTFDTVQDLRDQILETKGTETVPMVIVANKTDLVDSEGEMAVDSNKSVVTIDWEHGFVGVSAKENSNIAEIFKELLRQAKIKYNLSPALRKKRRQSLPPPEVARTIGARARGSSASPSSQRPGSSPSSHSRRSQQHRGKQSGTNRNSCMVS